MNANTMPQRWTEAWSSDSQQQAWVELFTHDGTYNDQGFLIHRVGHKTLARPWNFWRTANADFIISVAKGMPVWYEVDEAGNGKVGFKTINRGLLSHPKDSVGR